MAPKAKSGAKTAKQAVDKCRTTPVKQTVVHVRDLPKSAIIYQYPASSYWQFRVFIDGTTVKRSTKETDKAKAMQRAKLLYADMLQNVSGSGTHGDSKLSKRNTLNIVAESLFDRQEVEIAQGELYSEKNKNERWTFNRYILPFFKDYDIKKIDADAIDAFKKYLADANLATTSQKSHLVLLSKILKQAVRKHYLHSVPLMPKVRVDDTPRGYFDSNEYTKLWQTAKRYGGAVGGTTYEFKTDEGKVYRTVKITWECYELIMFMRNSYVRPTDIKVLRHRDIRSMSQDGIQMLELCHVPTKRHKNFMATTPEAVGHYQKICERRKAAGYGKPDDYVFMPQMSNRETALKELARQFTAVLRLAGLKTDKDGKDRTMYSLRHTAVTAALRSGISPEIVAANSRTSSDMIRRFYASHIQSAAEMGSAIVDAIRAKQARGAARLARRAEEKAAAGEQKRSEQAEVMAVEDGAELAEIIDIKALGKR